MNTYCTVLNIGKRNSLFEGDKISTVDDAHFKDDLSVWKMSGEVCDFEHF